MKLIILILLALISLGIAVIIDEACVARSEWEVEYKSHEISLSTFVPLNETAQILSIEVEFDGFSIPVTYDNIEIFSRKTKINRYRNAKPNPKEHDLNSFIGYGWADLIFTLDTRYGLKYFNGTELMSVDAELDHSPKSLKFKGSNITICCQLGKRLWTFSDYMAVIPLDGSGRFWLSFYSTKEFLPTVYLEMRDYQFRWNNESISTIPTNNPQPLPPYTEHHVMLNCWRDNKYTCDIQVGEERTLAEERVHLNNLLMSLTVGGRPNDSFFIILHQHDPLSPEVIIQSTPLEPKCEARSRWEIDYMESNVSISAWFSLLNSTKLLILQIADRTGTKNVFEETLVYSNRTVFLRRQNSTSEKFSTSLPDSGWVEFILTTGTDWSIKFYDLGKNFTHIPLNIPQDFIPGTLSISGSNITLNCPLEQRIWKVTNNTTFVPLDASTQHRFVLSSTREFSPTVYLDGKSLKKQLKISTSEPAPPFVSYQLTFTCQKNKEVSCSMKVGENITDFEDLEALPNSLLFTGSQGDSYSVFLHHGDSELQESCSADKNIYKWLPNILQAVIQFIVILIVVVLCWKYKTIWKKVKGRCCSKAQHEEDEDNDVKEETVVLANLSEPDKEN